MTQFDRQMARLLLEICRYTYARPFRLIDEQNDASNWINQQAIKPTSEFLLTDGKILSTSVASVFCYPDKNIVSYMGTKTQFDNIKNAKDSIADWLKNFRGLPVPFKLSAAQLGLEKDMELGGKVHDGFLAELKAVQAKIIEVLLKNGGKEKPLYITGHSQGGAEATLATSAFLAGGFSVNATYTFAAPRSGDQDFADSIPANFPFHRIEFGDDIVPHVPPTLLSKPAKELVHLLLHSPLPVPTKVKEILELSSQDLGYAGVGRLCYGDNKTRKLQIDLSIEQEHDIFLSRLRRLVTHTKNWAEHHHLAGTADEVKAGKKGNYTALVSDFNI